MQWGVATRRDAAGFSDAAQARSSEPGARLRDHDQRQRRDVVG
jgi:hypothetical protein